MQAQWDFGENLSALEVLRTKKKRRQVKMGSSKSIISEMEDAIQNTPLRAGNTISGRSGSGNDMGGIKGN